jgi:prephenate dehydrogenase
MKRIAIIGLGQIGGSLTLAIRQQRLPYHLTGIDVSSRRLKLLESKLDVSSRRWSDANADLNIVCMHFKETMEFLQQVEPELLVMDVCSAKKKILDFANKRKLRFIGGHPMAGNERAGEAAWDADLFTGRPFFVCPSRKARCEEIQFVEHLLWEIKAKPIEVNVPEHDRWVALSSHFPALVSKMIADMSKDVPELYRSSGYESMTRLAKTSPELLETFLDGNSENIRRSALQLRKQLDQLLRKLKPQSR